LLEFLIGELILLTILPLIEKKFPLVKFINHIKYYIIFYYFIKHKFKTNILNTKNYIYINFYTIIIVLTNNEVKEDYLKIWPHQFELVYTVTLEGNIYISMMLFFFFKKKKYKIIIIFNI